jgi:uncharacterized membrane protein YhiD involved in acid resistance
MTEWRSRALGIAIIALAAVPGSVRIAAIPLEAQSPPSQIEPAPDPAATLQDETDKKGEKKRAVAAESEEDARTERVRAAAFAMPIAAGLGAALALRPRRRGTPHRSPAVVQTQIILAVIGALVMLVVGSSLARAFGVVGAAGLIRYRAKIDDPKDAGVMLSTLAVGLASGVGLYGLSVFAAIFIMGMLWLIESFEPEGRKFFTLKVHTKDAAKVQPQLEDLLRRQQAGFELRTSSAEEISYEVRLPIRRSTDRLSRAILAIEGAASLDWNEEHKKAKTET